MNVVILYCINFQIKLCMMKNNLKNNNFKLVKNIQIDETKFKKKINQIDEYELNFSKRFFIKIDVIIKKKDYVSSMYHIFYNILKYIYNI